MSDGELEKAFDAADKRAGVLRAEYETRKEMSKVDELTKKEDEERAPANRERKMNTS